MARHRVEQIDEAAAWQELEQAGRQLGLGLPISFLPRARAYLTELERWMRVEALTGYRDPGTRVRHLLTESLLHLAAVPAPSDPLIDIGTGAGIPGLVIAWARPAWPITLVEASRRRANFLRHVARLLALPNVEIAEGRAEALAESALRGRFRTATMRAVPGGPLTHLLARPFLRPDGRLVVSLPPGPPVGGAGAVREVGVTGDGELPWRRRFLILAVTEISTGVSRGTSRVARAKHGRRQPKGGRRQDDDGREPGGGARAGRSTDAPR